MKQPRIISEVFQEFAWEGAASSWAWRLAVRRKYVVRSVNSFKSPALARRNLRAAARKLGIPLPRAKRASA